MNATEFEAAVRELRRRQRAFFHYRKDDPSREKAKELMRDKEKEVLIVVESVMAIRPQGKRAESERERFFLDVAEMLRRQKEWMRQGGGSWMMNPAKDAEKTVDNQLSRWDDQRKEEERRKLEEERKKQTSLFEP